MISTITTATVGAVTSASLAASLALLAIIALLLLLIQKEVLTAADGLRGQTLARILNVAIVPLLLSFLFIVVVKVVEAWR